MERLDYRREVGTDVWHWNPGCPDWPSKSFECAKSKPFTGQDCKKCGDSDALSSAAPAARRAAP